VLRQHGLRGLHAGRSLTLAVLMFAEHRISTASVSESAHGQPAYLRLAMHQALEHTLVRQRWNRASEPQALACGSVEIR